jgi:cytochrome c5
MVGLMVDYMTSTVTDDAIKNSPEMKAQVKRSMALSNGMKLYGQACFSCHNTGRNGAPRLGDGLAWDTRKKQSVETLVKHVVEGHGRMIVKGGSGVQSTKEVESMVKYMLSTLEPSLD